MTDTARVFELDTDPEAGLAEAAAAVANGECVVLPTDTVYGIGANAFDKAAVQRLLDAKERGRDMPPPVLMSTGQAVWHMPSTAHVSTPS